MGYRMYLGKSKKGNPITTTEDGYLTRNSENIVKLFELGKYVEWRDEDSENLLDEDEELYITNRNFLLTIIEEYRKLNKEHSDNRVEAFLKIATAIAQGEDIPELSEREKHAIVCEFTNLKSLKREWGGRYNCLQLEPSDDGQITSSWKYEYSIFNLVHILHTFDWENDDLIYYGY